MDASRIQLICEKLIKPPSPTPPSRRSYTLSHAYIPIALFYPSQPHSSSPGTTHISQLLENSLPKLLKSYYPFAGTLTDNVSIDCNDRGVTFVEARINRPMSEMLRGSDAGVQNIMFPIPPWSYADKEKLVLAQLNHFDCGGKALAVCTSHKLGDGYTLIKFVNDWAAISRQSSEEPSPQFIGTSIYSHKDRPIKPVFGPTRNECAAKRFSFGAKAIAQLKELVAAESGVQNPTRVEVITALLHKCAMTASIVNSQSFKPSVLIQFANMRLLTVPPLPQTTVGNFVSLFTTHIADEGEIKLSILVSKLRNGKVEFFDKCKRMNPNEFLSLDVETIEAQIEKNVSRVMDLYLCTGLCGFPHDFDFGWGKPTRVVFGPPPGKSGFMLIDDHNGDGVEAIVVLDEKVMPIFESDEEVLAFASPNQSL